MNREQLVEQAKRYHKRSCELAWKAEDYWNEHVRVNGKLDDADYQEYRRLADESEDLCAKSNSLFDQAIKLRDPHETAESDADTEADMFATTPASEKLVIDASNCSVSSENRFSYLSASVCPLCAALLPVMIQPATGTPTVTTHPVTLTHNPSIDSSPISSARRLVLAMPHMTSVGEPSGGPFSAARHHTTSEGASDEHGQRTSFA